jgi:TPP-dependent pyruvate/acetoin dehydrogenase alpha subunit
MNLEQIYRSLFRIRRVEEEAARVYPTDKIKSPMHLSIGQESVAVGVCDTLTRDDVVFITYRSHAGYLAKGGDMNAMIAELYGKATGCAKGKGGSMHLVDVANGVMGASAVVGTSIANAVGYAYKVKLRKEKRIVVVMFGDGATEEGVFYESLNFAALKKLPILFICENNGFAIFTHQTKRQAVPEISRRVEPFGIPAKVIGDDVLALRSEIEATVQQMKESGEGPYFFECQTYRWREHVGPSEDYTAGHRTREEAAPWIANDQVARVAGMLDASARSRIEAEVEAEITAAFEFAENSLFPDDEELFRDVYKS